ncbi:MAG: hypothetical protein HYR60_27845 [Acidobacteria bacterium]|nr:hypothetical protein [Acidobacteriota bacterium]
MFSKVIRRIHMYLALFLTPWVLVYALSTMAMNHRDFFKKRYGGPILLYEKEREQAYPATFPAGTAPKAMALRILGDLHLEGAHNVRGSAAGTITIQRQDPLTPRRITYTPAAGKLLIEREVFRTPVFLERMHRRRGYQHDYALEDTWAFSVDLFIAGMIFWVLSGLWMWWELRVTRGLGALFLAVGLALFGFYVTTI